ncbi:MAG: CarD family transcriptional regulator [Deltaproteobacteria bacterium]|nr:CarD family transcriptional regulator [Deltaproteobacteria bacterium]
MFGVGDKAVYPAQGVGEILAIEPRDIMGKSMEVYVMRILDREMTILIPTSKSHDVGLRRVMGTDEVDAVFDVLKQRRRVNDSQTWNRRFREYSEKIRTGSAVEIAQVLRDLYLLRSGKNLSYGEKRMLHTALELLSQEIAVAQGQKTCQAQARILSAFGDVTPAEG